MSLILEDETVELEDSPGKVTFTKPELIEKLAAAFQDYRKEMQLPHYHTFSIPLSTLTHKILFGSFELEKGFSTHPSWSNIWSRIDYTLADFAEKKDKEFYITPDVEKKIQAFMDGTNCSKPEITTEITTEINNLITIDPAVYYELTQMTVFTCTICQKYFLKKDDILTHLKNHYLAEFEEVK